MRTVCLCLAVPLFATALSAQQQPPSGAQSAKQPAKPLSGSLGLYVFPAQNQSPLTQQGDEAACYSWAKENTGFDPIAAGSAAKPADNQQAAKGAAAKGAAGGAAAGAAIGAVAGDAGQGAAVGATAGAIRGRIAAKKAERKAEQAKAKSQQQQAAGMDGFRKAFGACMEGKSYTVK